MSILIEHCAACGTQVNYVPPHEIENLREAQACYNCGANLRIHDLARIMLQVLGLEAKRSLAGAYESLANMDIYEIGSVGAIHDVLSKIPHFVYSEYFEDTPPGVVHPSGVRCEDVQRLSFGDASFDLVISQDVLEHVADPKLGLQEIYRVLRPGGYHIYTVPFSGSMEKSFTRASMIDGKVHYHVPPVYHGGPIRVVGALVFTDFGQDFLSVQRALGFDISIHETTVTSCKGGYNVVFVAQKHVSPAKSAAGERPSSRTTVTTNNQAITPAKKAAPDLPKFDASISKKEAEKLIFPVSSQTPEVSIVIPVYNKWKYTLNCLKSIAENTIGDYEVVVIDDASTDETAQALSHVKNLNLVTNEQNSGFVESCNRGGRISKGKYILFLNNDTMVTKDWLPPLLELIKREDVGAVGSKLVYRDGVLQEAGSIVWNDGSALGYGRGDNAEKPEYNYVREVDYCSGACLLVKRELLEKVGGFDDRFKPGYYEDTDLCFALRNLGYRVMYQPKSVVVHFEGVTCGTDIYSGIKKYQEINKPKFVSKWNTVLSKYDCYASYKNIFSSRNKLAGKSILVLDDRIPTPAQGSGYPRAYRLVKFLRELGYKVTFFPLENPTPWAPYTNEFQQLGIETFYGENLDFLQFAKDRAGYYDLVLVSRPHNMKKALHIIKRFFSNAALIYDAEALFSIRDILKAEVKGSRLKDEDVERLVNQEINLMKKADLIVMVSENEKRIIAEKAKLDNVAVWGYPIEVKEPKTPFSERKDILFVGGFPCIDSPNEDAIVYFVNEVFPAVQKELACQLFVVGINPPASVKKLASRSIIVTGYVEDLREYYERCRVFVVPHRYSAGIPLKLHEAMSYGIPSVVSELTADQLNLTDGKVIMVAKNTEEFKQKVIKLYQEEKLWYRIQGNALNYIREDCNPETLKTQLNDIIEMIDDLKRKLVEMYRIIPMNLKTRPSVIADKISVIIPVKNGGEQLRGLLQKIKSQRKVQDIEIIVIDSESTDNSVQIAKEFGAKIISIPQREFNHGATRNLGAKSAKGDYLVFTVQDAVPINDYYLYNMICPFFEYPELAALSSKQFIKPEADLFSLCINEFAIKSSSLKGDTIYSLSDATKEISLELFDSATKRRLGLFDNVSSCIKRSVFEEIQFSHIIYAEDLDYGLKLIERKKTLGFLTSTGVYHWHERGADYVFKRHYIDTKASVYIPKNDLPYFFDMNNINWECLAANLLGIYELISISISEIGEVNPEPIKAVQSFINALQKNMDTLPDKIEKTSKLDSRLHGNDGLEVFSGENVIPAKAGIQTPSPRKRGAIHQGIGFPSSRETLDSRLHGNDGLEAFSGEDGGLGLLLREIVDGDAFVLTQKYNFKQNFLIPDFMKRFENFTGYLCSKHHTLQGREKDFISCLYKIFAMAAGEALGAYYLEAETLNRLTPELKRIDQLLGKGVCYF